MGSVEQQKHSSSTSTQRRTVDNMRIILFFSLLVGSVWSLPGITKRSTRVGPKQDKQTGIPINPPDGQRCSGRDYQGRRCCTPENPCDEGEGDCDGPGDGGLHDGHAGCKGDLVCGSNNCKKFGHYYHEKDDCCERPETSNPLRHCAMNNVKFTCLPGPGPKLYNTCETWDPSPNCVVEGGTDPNHTCTPCCTTEGTSIKTCGEEVVSEPPF